jgi:predicted NBD/HSP70 family sugar kinase
MKYLVLDIGGTAIKYALMDERAAALDRGQVATPLAGFDAFRAEIIRLYKIYQDQIDGIAFSLPGVIDSEQGRSITGGSLTYNDNRNFVADFQDYCRLPITIENDAKCAALAEAWQGSLSECKNGVVVVLGTEVGGGIIVDGQLYKGSHFAAGEFSYLLTNICHHKGEPYRFLGPDSGTRGLCRAVEHNKHLGSGCVDGRQAFAWANEDDDVVCETLDDYTYNLAMLFFNLQALFDPDVIAVGGGISAEPLLFQFIEKNIAYLEEHLSKRLITPKVVRCKFMNDANLIGALKHHLQHAEDDAAFPETDEIDV